MRIGIYAGTFDPIHNGHLQFAQKAIERVGLDKVIIIAEKLPYRKKPHASWDHRQAMIERATTSEKNIDHDYSFATALAHQHTLQDMVTVSAKHYGTTHEYWFLVGSDVFEHMSQWKSLAHHSEYGGFIVALRDDHTEQWITEQRLKMHHKNFNPEVTIIDSPHPHVSSSDIRKEVGQHLRPLQITDPVYTYIISHNLYQ